MADMVGGDTIGELMDAFSKFQNHDGLIGTPELKNVLRSLGHNPTDAELQELAYAMDTNESGTIDLPEFLQAMAKNKADEDAEEDIREAFKVKSVKRDDKYFVGSFEFEFYSVKFASSKVDNLVPLYGEMRINFISE